MLKITIIIEAKTYSGVENSINEAKKRIMNENRMGFDGNEDESFEFSTEGREEEVEHEED